VLALRIAALLVLLCLNAVVPGFVLVRKLRWRPIETLCAAVGASLVVLYLATFALYLSGAPMSLCGVGTAGSVLAAAAFRDDLRRLLAGRAVRSVVVGFALLLAWGLCFVGLVRHFGGGGWGGDWLEHFHRCLYFLYRLPTDTPLNGMYHVTARPPFMNVLGAYFLAQAGDDFECFQVVFAFLNTLPFLAGALLAARLWGRGTAPPRVLAALFAMSPFFVVNVTYTWTKLLSAFFVLLAVHFYLAARTRGDAARQTAWPLALAAALLVHYSAGPFAVFLVGHHLWSLVRRVSWRAWPARLVPALPGVLLLATWLAWALLSFGLSRTATSNTAVGDSRGLGVAGNAAKIAWNVVDTVIPHPLRTLPADAIARQERAGYVRDFAFLIYQTNVLAAMGSVGGVLAVVLWIGGARKRWRTDTGFWAAFVPFTLLAGIATHGGRDSFGVAHVTLQPLVLLGLTLLAAGWRSLGPALRWAAIAGCVLDFGLGIGLHHEVENAENTAQAQVFDDDGRVGPLGLEWRREDGVSQSMWQGWKSKHERQLLDRELERARKLGGERGQRLAAAVEPERERLIARDTHEWNGWFARHGQGLTFLGDHVAGAAWPLHLAIAGMLAVWLRAFSRASGS